MTLTINGNEYPFRLELGAMRLFAIKSGKKKIKTQDLGKLMTEADIVEEYPILIWAGLKAGDSSFDGSIEDVTSWLEEDPAAFDRAMDLMNDDTDPPETEDGEPSGKGTKKAKK